jgi:E3 ubiquitin-protein ligase RNF144
MDPEQVSILDCTHVYHFQCLYEHVRNSIEGGQPVVRCPSEHCGIELAQEELANFLTPELEKKLEDFMLNQYVERNGNCTSWCPTPDCHSLFEFDPTVTDYSCRNCAKRYCLKCRCDYHQGMTCREYREYMGMNPEDQSFLDFARGARFKQCPRCRFWVEKAVGCVSMKCRCSQEFCY